jgi:transglutaminase-like putative cysteine protease
MPPEAAEAGAGIEATYLLEQRFRYTYPAAVRRLSHRLVVVPRAVHGAQRRIDHGLTVSGSPAAVVVTSDPFANHVVELRAALVAEWIEFDSWALVRRHRADGTTPLAPKAMATPVLLAPTPLTRPDGVLAAAARDVSAAGARGLDLAERACSWAHRALTYPHGVTGVRTTAAAALAAGRGVCQDYAHVMLALCRAAGLPARYVSGHLVGEGGSHAWVEVLVGDPASPPARSVTAVAFDPTHDRRAGPGYLTVAVGRDYADVAPTSGTFEGGQAGTLTASKRLRLVPTPPEDIRPGWCRSGGDVRRTARFGALEATEELPA